MTAFMVVTALLILLLLGMLSNQGLAVVRKINLQARADAIAVAVGTSQADAFNRLVSLQHLIGEQLAWAVVPEALAGPGADAADLGPDDRRAADQLDARIGELAPALNLLGQATPAADELRQPIRSGATTGQAKLRLRQVLVRLYEQRLAGEQADPADENEILSEWLVLTQLEDQARAAVAAKESLLTGSIPALLASAKEIVDQRGAEAARQAATAAGLDTADGLVSGLWPLAPALPVQPESLDLDLNAPDPLTALRQAQIVQAAWPWVLYDRQPVRQRLEPLVIANAAALYDDWALPTTTRLARRVYLESGLALFVMADSVRGSQGAAPWIQDSRLADHRFGILALAYRTAPTPLAERIFPATNPDGLLAHAQLMLYNAPPQPVQGDDPQLQPCFGWDTLNWSVPVARSGNLTPVVMPQVQPNWRARLVPVTLLNEASDSLPDPFRAPVAPLVPVPRSLQTH
jgi:hypothetical protein